MFYHHLKPHGQDQGEKDLNFINIDTSIDHVRYLLIMINNFECYDLFSFSSSRQLFLEEIRLLD
jgi:hypothetical protein